jgi:glucose/arabinose dehydrogenase
VRAPALALVPILVSAALFACSPSSNPDNPPDDRTPAPGGDVVTTQDGVRFRVEVVISNLQIPWSMAFAPDGRLFVTERPGRVRIYTQNASTSEVALALDDVFAQGEAGLLGIALDPDFTSNHFVYLYYTAQVGGGAAVNRVIRYREVTNRFAERVVLLDNIPANAIHDGGRLRFGPDGFLYVTTGDAATTSRAQDVTSLAGKILRITRDGATPRDNPFSSPVYSIGHRNPQGIDWHPVTADLWASEHGNSGNDEVNVIEAGADYGWPRIEGSQTMPGMRTPIRFYSPAVAPSGASFYRGTRFPAFVNNLFVATLRGTHILRLRIDAGSPRAVAAEERLLSDRFGRVRDVIVGPDGLIYFCTSNRDGRGSPVAADDRVARLVPAS